MILRSLWAGLCFALMTPPILAQHPDSTAHQSAAVRFIGEVRSITTTLPVEAADIRLMFVDSVKVRTDGSGSSWNELFVDTTRSRLGITNADGEFAIRGVGPGHYMVNVRRIGFEPFEGLLTLDTATVQMELALTQVSAILPRITISASATNKVTERLDRTGFTTRSRVGTSALFLERAELLRRKPRYLTDVLEAYGIHSADIIIDHMPSDWDLLKSYPADLVIGMEIYRKRSSLPTEFNMTKMGSSALSQAGQADLMRPTVVVWTFVL